MLNDVRGNSCAGITKHYLDLLALAEITRRDLQLSSIWHRITAIVHEVEKNLVQTVAIGRDVRQTVVERDRCLNILRLEHWPHQQCQLTDCRIDVSRF